MRMDVIKESLPIKGKIYVLWCMYFSPPDNNKTEFKARVCRRLAKRKVKSPWQHHQMGRTGMREKEREDRKMCFAVLGLCVYRAKLGYMTCAGVDWQPPTRIIFGLQALSPWNKLDFYGGQISRGLAHKPPHHSFLHTIHVHLYTLFSFTCENR